MARKWVGEQKTTPRFMRRQGKGNLGFAILLFWVVAFGFWLITTPPGLRNEKQDGNGRASLPSDKEELDEESVAEPYESTAFDTSKHLKCFSLDCTKPNNFRALSKCGKLRATQWNERGVAAMERYLEGPLRDLIQYNNNFLLTAFDYFVRATQEDNNCDRAWTNLAIVQIVKGDDREAMQSLREAIKMNSKQADYYAIRGFLFELLGNLNQARADWQKAERLNPIIGEGRYLGIILGNDTRAHQRNIFPLIKESHHSVESNTMRKCLAFIEFSRYSIADYGIVAPQNKNDFRSQKFIVLRKLVPPFLLSALQANYDTMQTMKKIPLGDTVSKRYAIYNDRASVFFHYQITDKVRRIIHHNAFPTYSYYGGYIAGSTLDPHTDRQQCEFTMSLSILQRPLDKPWPLSLGKTPRFERNNSAESDYNLPRPPDSDTVHVPLYEGDALLFMGRHLVHFREGTLHGDERTSNLFLHWVQDDFDADLD